MFLADVSAAAQGAASGLLALEHLGYRRPEVCRVSLELRAQGSCPPYGVLELLDERRDTGVCLFKCGQERQAHRGVVELLVELVQ